MFYGELRVSAKLATTQLHSQLEKAAPTWSHITFEGFRMVARMIPSRWRAFARIVIVELITLWMPGNSMRDWRGGFTTKSGQLLRKLSGWSPGGCAILTKPMHKEGTRRRRYLTICSLSGEEDVGHHTRAVGLVACAVPQEGQGFL